MQKINLKAILIFQIVIIILAACVQATPFSEILDGPDGQVLSISPSEAQLLSSQSLTLEIEGGVPPYELTLSTALGGSGEKLTDNSYTAPSDKTGMVIVQVEDSYGATGQSLLTIVSPSVSLLTLSPSFISIYRGKKVTLEANGGTGEYSYSLEQSIGGTGESLINNLYTAPSDLGGTAIVKVTDSQLNTAETTINVATSSPALDDVNYNTVSVTTYESDYSGGSDFSGSFTFKNSGSDDGTQSISWIVYYSEDLIIGSGDTIVSQGSESPLEAYQDSLSIPFSGTWPYPDKNTDYNLIVSLSAEDDLYFSDNTGYITVPVEIVVMKNIDYLIEDTDEHTPPSNVGDETYIGFNIKNEGSADGTDQIFWGAYASEDENWDEEDTLITSATIEALLSGDYSDWLDFNLPWPELTGTYYLILKVLAEDEINKTNNYEIIGPFVVDS
ncbi:hypothetical protein EXM22_01010 [Oceanispirochaeta crateris]|uniref:CARDB domain-containing protein n=1 Tax=Oceanispirochaeta crateris TaxID=2518645 RepID=A0A5C1QJG8_9SPIO|nr:hypothetical protein [Oceanispirochaeta crateris]QEN06636.1 hypothetical protein EXM22_01010 [Oceanispirochaeta crateris]